MIHPVTPDDLDLIGDALEDLEPGLFLASAEELAAMQAMDAAMAATYAAIEEATAAEVARIEAEPADGPEPDGPDDDPVIGGGAARPARPRLMTPAFGNAMLARALAYNRAHGIVIAFEPGRASRDRAERRRRARARLAA
jgi:hypothetical protein